jgi:hypothetical protein
VPVTVPITPSIPNNSTNSNNTSNPTNQTNSTNPTNSTNQNNNTNSSQTPNTTNSTNTSCPSGKVYDLRTNTCIILTYLSSIPQNITNFYGSPNNEIGSIPQGTVGVSCPPEFPFSNSTHCLSCNYPSFFNYTSKLCQNCPVNEIF